MKTQQKLKQTEIGEIPEDWEVKTLSELTDSNGLIRGPFGGSLKKEFFVKKGIKVYEQKNAIYRDIEIGDYYIDQNKFLELRRFEVKSGDFIVSCSGTIGRIYMIPENAPQGIINQALLILRLNSVVVDEMYFYQYFSWEKFQDKIIDSTQGGAMKNLVGMDVFRNTKLVLPKSIKEQAAIAQVLSDTDNLIQKLDKLIDKKKDIKKGAMQELLTGKKRLEGFSGEWEFKKLIKITSMPVTDGPHLTPKFLESGVPFLSVNNIVNYKIDWSDLRYISKEDDIEFSKKCKPQEGDILLGKAATVGTVAVVETDRDFNIWSPLALIRIKKEYANRFFYYYFQAPQIITQIKLLTNSSSQGNIGMRDIEKLEFPVPSKEEQTAIANVLSDMDAEIEELNQKKEKLKMIKEGMMQQLLTGRIRLDY